MMDIFKLNLNLANAITLLLFFICNSNAMICEKEFHCDRNNEILDCRDKNLDCLPPLGIMKIIRLSQNKIFRLSVNDLVDTKSLIELDISDNKISDIEDNVFRYTEIKNLYMNYNFISKLTANTFGSSPKMNLLDLSFNNISIIDSSTFNGLYNLEYLNLERNPLMKIPDSLFFSLNKLRILSLRQTNLYQLAYTTFNGVEIEDLNLQGNHFTKIPTDMFSRAQTLLNLNLDENPIKIISSRAFKFLSKLRTLSLKNMNQLSSIDLDAFADLKNLKYIDISHNRNLKYIHTYAFRGINGYNTNLTQVNLRDNSLTSIDQAMLPWRSIRSIDLEENPFLCDCKMVWLRSIVWDFELTSDLLCDSPKSLQGKYLMNIDIDQFQCKKNLFRVSTLIIGIGVSLCIVLAIIAIFILYKKKCVEVIQASQQVRYTMIDDKLVQSNSEWISSSVPEEQKLTSAVDV